MVRVTRVVCSVDVFLCENKTQCKDTVAYIKQQRVQSSRLHDNLKLEKFNNLKVPCRLSQGLNHTRGARIIFKEIV